MLQQLSQLQRRLAGFLGDSPATQDNVLNLSLVPRALGVSELYQEVQQPGDIFCYSWIKAGRRHQDKREKGLFLSLPMLHNCPATVWGHL